MYGSCITAAAQILSFIYHCTCPPARDFGSRVSGLVSSLFPIFLLPSLILLLRVKTLFPRFSYPFLWFIILDSFHHCPNPLPHFCFSLLIFACLSVNLLVHVSIHLLYFLCLLPCAYAISHSLTYLPS